MPRNAPKCAFAVVADNRSFYFTPSPRSFLPRRPWRVRRGWWVEHFGRYRPKCFSYPGELGEFGTGVDFGNRSQYRLRFRRPTYVRTIARLRLPRHDLAPTFRQRDAVDVRQAAPATLIVATNTPAPASLAVFGKGRGDDPPVLVLRFSFACHIISIMAADNTKLIFGPYRPPRCRIGGKLRCVVRGDVVVRGISDSPIQWPFTYRNSVDRRPSL